MKLLQHNADFEGIMQKVQGGTIDPYKAVQMAMLLAIRKE